MSLAAMLCVYAIPFLATVGLWWVSTGVILMLDSRDKRSYRASMVGASVLLGAALWLIAATARETTAAAAYLAFGAGLVVWGWQLLAFYTGVITGPNKAPLRPRSSTLSRFAQGLGASLHHEIAAALGALGLFALVHGAPNRMALWTYVILWTMHTSAKLNLFLGVPNLGADMLPRHLAFLTSFMARRRMNALFPASVTAGTAASVLLFAAAIRGRADGFDAAGYSMLGSLMALAVVEHWFLIAPVDGNALWRSFRRRTDGARATARRVERALAGETTAANSEPETGSLSAFRADPPKVCDARTLERLLESIAAGRFGAVECVHGLVRTEAEWVCFELREGRARMAAFGPRPRRTPLVIAKGEGFDRARLKAAFDGCAAAA